MISTDVNIYIWTIRDISPLKFMLKEGGGGGVGKILTWMDSSISEGEMGDLLTTATFLLALTFSDTSRSMLSVCLTEATSPVFGLCNSEREGHQTMNSGIFLYTFTSTHKGNTKFWEILKLGG